MDFKECIKLFLGLLLLGLAALIGVSFVQEYTSNVYVRKMKEQGYDVYVAKNLYGERQYTIIPETTESLDNSNIDNLNMSDLYTIDEPVMKALVQDIISGKITTMDEIKDRLLDTDYTGEYYTALEDLLSYWRDNGE